MNPTHPITSTFTTENIDTMSFESEQNQPNTSLQSQLSKVNSTTDTSGILAAAEKRVDLIEKITTVCLRVTNEKDWQNFDGHAYLNNSGCKKVARLFGLSFKLIRMEKALSRDDLGEYYIYTCEIEVGMRNPSGQLETVTEIGTKSSRNKFFAKVKGELKPSSEIDETAIKKAAFTNCLARGIKALLGLDTLSWDQLQEAWKNTGKNTNTINKTTFASGGQGGGLISAAQQKRLYAIYKSAGKTDDEMKAYLKEKYQVEHTKDIKTSDYNAICTWAENGNK